MENNKVVLQVAKSKMRVFLEILKEIAISLLWILAIVAVIVFIWEWGYLFFTEIICTI